MSTRTSQPLSFWSFLLSLCHQFTSTRWTGDTGWHTEELVDRAGLTPPEKGQAGSRAFSLIQLSQSNVNSLPLPLLGPMRIWAYTWIYRLSWSLFFFFLERSRSGQIEIRSCPSVTRQWKSCVMYLEWWERYPIGSQRNILSQFLHNSTKKGCLAFKKMVKYGLVGWLSG